jgi:hypothetical protein
LDYESLLARADICVRRELAFGIDEVEFLTLSDETSRAVRENARQWIVKMQEKYGG